MQKAGETLKLEKHDLSLPHPGMLPNIQPRDTNIITLGRQTSASSRCFAFSPNERSGDAGPQAHFGEFEWIVKRDLKHHHQAKDGCHLRPPGAEGLRLPGAPGLHFPEFRGEDSRSPAYYSCSRRAYTELWTTCQNAKECRASTLPPSWTTLPRRSERKTVKALPHDEEVASSQFSLPLTP